MEVWSEQIQWSEQTLFRPVWLFLSVWSSLPVPWSQERRLLREPVSRRHPRAVLSISMEEQ